MHGVLLGLYPDNASDIPVQTSTLLEEVMLAQVTQCSQLGAWYKSVREYLAHDVRPHAHLPCREIVHRAVDAMLVRKPAVEMDTATRMHAEQQTLDAAACPVPLPRSHVPGLRTSTLVSASRGCGVAGAPADAISWLMRSRA